MVGEVYGHVRALTSLESCDGCRIVTHVKNPDIPSGTWACHVNKNLDLLEREHQTSRQHVKQCMKSGNLVRTKELVCFSTSC